MIKWILPALLLCTGSSAFAQINYVLNPDFETYTFCPTANNQISASKYWTGIDSIGFNACDPDYNHACVTMPNNTNTIPGSLAYWQYPRSGNGMAQMVLYYKISTAPNLELRNYLQGRLKNTLISGKNYCLTFYVNLVEGSGYAFKDISAYLDNGSIDTAKDCAAPQIGYAPQVSNNGSIIVDTMNWTKIQGTFVATGKENFITIGNFKDNAHSTVLPRTVSSQYTLGNAKEMAAYLIDDISIIESDLKADAGTDRHIGKGDSTYVGRPKEVGLECTWNVLGSSTVIGTGAGLWVKPATTTSYVVTQTLCGQVKKDTVRVEVWGVGINSVNGQAQEYSVTPNPGGEIIEIHQAVMDDRPIQIALFEVTGKHVFSRNISMRDRTTTLNLPGLVPGLYYLLVRDDYGNAFTLKLIRK